LEIQLPDLFDLLMMRKKAAFGALVIA